MDRLVGGRLVEEVANREQHLPLGGGEVHERQRLTDLHIEAGVERLAIGNRVAVRKAVADAVQHGHPRCGFRDVGLEGRGPTPPTLIQEVP